MRKTLFFAFSILVVGMLILAGLVGTVTVVQAKPPTATTPPPTPPPTAGTITWTGNGSTTCPSGCHWVLAPSSNTLSGTLVIKINGVVVESVILTQNGSGSFAGDSTGAFDPTTPGLTVEVDAICSGACDDKIHLQLSHANDCTSDCGTEPPTTPPPTTETTTETVTTTATTPPPPCTDDCGTETTTVTTTITSTTDPCIDHPEQCATTPPPTTPPPTTPPPTTPPPSCGTEGQPPCVTETPPSTPQDICSESGHKNDPDCESDYHRKYIPHVSGGDSWFAAFLANLISQPWWPPFLR